MFHAEIKEVIAAGEKPPAICATCKFHSYEISHKYLPSLWKCGAREVKAFNFISGVEIFSRPDCDKYNSQGECKLWEATDEHEAECDKDYPAPRRCR